MHEAAQAPRLFAGPTWWPAWRAAEGLALSNTTTTTTTATTTAAATAAATTTNNNNDIIL